MMDNWIDGLLGHLGDGRTVFVGTKPALDVIRVRRERPFIET